MVFESKSTTQVINDILVDVIENTQEVTDLNPGSILRAISEALGQELGLQYTQLQNVFNGTRIDTATGADLENLGAIIGTPRDTGSNSSGTITFIRDSIAVADFTIPVSTILSTDPNSSEETLRFLTS